MTVDNPQHQTSRFDVSDWSDASARATLLLIAESVAQMVGFEVAVISAVQGEHLISVAIKGADDVVATLSQMRTPMENIHAELAVADDWGRFKFVAHDKAEVDDEFRWIPDIVPGTDADSWHPLDALLAPLYTEDGQLCGLLSIDLPLNGRRPDRAQLGLLERYAVQAERALLNAFEREDLAQRLRLAEAARQVVRFAVSQQDIEAALDDCRPALLEGFRADELTIRTYADDSATSGGTVAMPVSQAVRDRVRALAHVCWEHRNVGILARTVHDWGLVDAEEYAALYSLLEDLGYGSAMLVPIGAGRRCLGHLILFRKDEDLLWTADERTGALEVARDVGHAVLAARNLTQEQRLVTELRQLDTYKTQLLSTVSHELKNPLGAIAGHLELVANAPDLSDDVQFSISAMTRATNRVSRVVEDLLILAKLEDPDNRQPAAVLDLRPAIHAAADSTQFAAEQRRVSVEVSAPSGPLPVQGDAEGLERLLTNLLSNAVKYSRRGGVITVDVTYRDAAREVEVAVRDEGIGISAADREHLFSEFFRSTNPEALAQPGTGLGLAISSRIVRSHGGRIEVESTPGEGSTFRAILPVPD